MSDVRETILLRLMTVFGTVAGVTKVLRNADEINELMRPAIILFDGSEDAREEEQPRNRSITPPRIVTMTPDVLVLMGDAAADIGSTVNVMRARIIKAVLTDTTLAALTLNGNGVIYLGCETNLERGRETEAELNLSFAIPYLLKPSAL